MSNKTNSLQSNAQAGIATVSALPPQGMITVRGDFADASFADAVKSVTGVGLPAQREILAEAGHSIGWMSPDELLVMCAHDKADAMVADLNAAFDGQHALAVNVSDARAVFTVEGDQAREVLAKLAPVDLAPAAFKPGELRRTRVAQVAAAFWLETETRFRIVCFRSVGKYMNDILTKSSRAGSAVDHF